MYGIKLKCKQLSPVITVGIHNFTPYYGRDREPKLLKSVSSGRYGGEDGGTWGKVIANLKKRNCGCSNHYHVLRSGTKPNSFDSETKGVWVTVRMQLQLVIVVYICSGHDEVLLSL